MKKIILMLLTIFSIQGCGFSYYEPQIKATPLEHYWGGGASSLYSAKVVTGSSERDERNGWVQNPFTYTSFSLLIYNPDSKVPDFCRQRSPYSTIEILFPTLSTKHEFIFDDSQTYLSSQDGRQYRLQRVVNNGKTVVPYSKTNLRGNRFFNFSSPLVCEQLEGAVFEMRGVYKDGVELPPVKFRINYLHPEKIPGLR